MFCAGVHDRKVGRKLCPKKVCVNFLAISIRNLREVLHGVGADGVGVKFPIFAVKCCCLPLSFRRSREKRRKRGKMRRKRGKMRRKRGKMRKKKGKITPTPSAPTPLRTSQNLYDLLHPPPYDMDHILFNFFFCACSCAPSPSSMRSFVSSPFSLSLPPPAQHLSCPLLCLLPPKLECF